MVAKRQEGASSDTMPTRIGQAVMLHRGGDREEARNRLGELWQELGPDGDALHRCTLAHYLADTQDDPADELAWDLRALAAADRAVRERGTAAAGGLAAGAGEPGEMGAERAGGPLRGGEAGHRPQEEPCGAGSAPHAAGGGDGASGGGADGGAVPGDEQSAEPDGQQAVAAVRGLYPSLHLNLAADYLRLGQLEAARSQLALAEAASGALADDPYGQGVRAAIGRMAVRLSGAVDGQTPSPRQPPWS